MAKKTKNTGIWTMNTKGNLLYSTEGDVLRHRYSPDSVFEHSNAGLVILFICAAVDFTLFYQMFSKILYDSPVLLVISIIAMIVGFDFGPVYLGMLWKRDKQGYNVDRLMICALAAIFVFAFVVNFAMRIAIRDIALPDLASDMSSIISGTARESAKNPLAPVYSVFAATLPLITSVVSFVVSNVTYNPLLAEKKKLEEAMLDLDNDIMITKSTLTEYDADSNMLERMLIDDDNRYDSAIGAVYTIAKMYEDYVRERIKEEMGDAAASNVLSAPTGEAILQRLDDTSGIYRTSSANSIIRQYAGEDIKSDADSSITAEKASPAGRLELTA